MLERTQRFEVFHTFIEVLWHMQYLDSLDVISEEQKSESLILQRFYCFPLTEPLNSFLLNRTNMVNCVLKEKSNEIWLHTKLYFTTNFKRLFLDQVSLKSYFCDILLVNIFSVVTCSCFLIAGWLVLCKHKDCS